MMIVFQALSAFYAAERAYVRLASDEFSTDAETSAAADAVRATAEALAGARPTTWDEAEAMLDLLAVLEAEGHWLEVRVAIREAIGARMAA